METACGFFQGRRQLELDWPAGGRKKQRQFAEYLNVPASIGTVISKRLATLAELDSVLGTEDLYNLLEIAMVDSYNARIANSED